LGPKVALALLAPIVLLAVLEGLLAGVAMFMRAPRPAPTQTDDNARRVRVLVLGDSFSYGVYLPPEQSYPAQLQAVLEGDYGQRFQFINAAQPGRSPSMIWHDLDTVLDATKPDHILLLAGFNMSDADIVRYRDATGEGVSGVRGAMLRASVTLSRLRSFRLLRNVVLRSMPRTDELLQVDTSMRQFDFRLYQEVNAWALDGLIGAIQQRGIDLVVLNYPQAPVRDNSVGEEHEYYYVIFMREAKPLTHDDYLFERRPREMALNAIISALVRKHRVPLVDNFAAFDRVPERGKLFLPNDEHPNADGYGLMAKTVAKVLAEHWKLKSR
jgi:lysophospholipase L1-like esterase